VYVGDPINVIRIFNEKEVDEIVLLDILASLEKRGPNFDLLKEIASECFMPLAYGGGITSIDQIRILFRIGIEKVILNTSLIQDPNFVRKAVATFGSQAITASIDVRRKLLGRREVMTLAGTESTGLAPVDAARKAEELGVGEILLTSIDAEGSMDGYDIDLLAKVSKSVNVPVIASGGAGKIEDFRKALHEGHASAVSAGSMFVFYGPHRAVLITYPEYHSLCEAIN
jgi:imidazole glycerol-phosphate synthase subunit HisF